jgi:adenylosuccinate synthase
VVDDTQIITHLVPSGCRYPGTLCVLGAGMVIDPDVFQTEVAALREHDLLAQDELRVSSSAHVVFPFHRVLDGLREDWVQTGVHRIGTTRRGVGPTYEAKAGRRGIRVGDLYHRSLLRERLEHCKAAFDPEFERLGSDHRIDVDDLLARGQAWGVWMQPWVCDVGALCEQAIGEGRRVLFEGAQGAMLDVDHGTYPFVTSSNAIAGGACTGIGIGPTRIDHVWGITKAYTTRVGAGPFPTRIEGQAGQRLRDAGSEYGATTGRPRDCGWLDLPALRYAARLNGMDGLCVTKLDVLADLPEAHVCVGYEDGLEPGSDDLARAVPILNSIPGWGDPQLGVALRRARSQGELPKAARTYLDLIAEAVDVEIVLVSVGPQREQTVALRDAFEPR